MLNDQNKMELNKYTTNSEMETNEIWKYSSREMIGINL